MGKKKRLFNINDSVILKNGQKGLIFRLPNCEIDSKNLTCWYDDNPIYGVLFVDEGYHTGPYDVFENNMTLYPPVIPNLNPIYKIESMTCPHCAGQLKIAYYDTIVSNGDHRRHLIEFISTMSKRIMNKEVLYLRDTSFQHPHLGFLEIIRVLRWDGDLYVEAFDNGLLIPISDFTKDEKVKYTQEWLHMLLTTNSDLNKVYQLVDIYGFTNKKKEN